MRSLPAALFLSCCLAVPTFLPSAIEARQPTASARPCAANVLQVCGRLMARLVGSADGPVHPRRPWAARRVILPAPPSAPCAHSPVRPPPWRPGVALGRGTDCGSFCKGPLRSAGARLAGAPQAAQLAAWPALSSVQAWQAQGASRAGTRRPPELPGAAGAGGSAPCGDAMACRFRCAGCRSPLGAPWLAERLLPAAALVRMLLPISALVRLLRTSPARVARARCLLDNCAGVSAECVWHLTASPGRALSRGLPDTDLHMLHRALQQSHCIRYLTSAEVGQHVALPKPAPHLDTALAALTHACLADLPPAAACSALSADERCRAASTGSASSGGAAFSVLAGSGLLRCCAAAGIQATGAEPAGAAPFHATR